MIKLDRSKTRVKHIYQEDIKDKVGDTKVPFS